MSGLLQSSLLSRDALDESRYAESLIVRATGLNLIDAPALNRRLLALIRRQCETYIAGRSASIAESDAHRIAESTLYTLSLRLKTIPEPIAALALLLNGVLDDLYAEGRAIAGDRIRRSQLAYEIERARTAPTGNECFDGTFFEAIPGFFRFYNPEYGAAETHITADYPVLNVSRSLRGIEFIAEYLSAWQMENRVLRLLPPGFARRTTAQYAARAGLNYSELEENLFLIAMAASIEPREGECGRLLQFLKCDSAAVREYLLKTVATRESEWKLLRGVLRA